jgi:hypothetical protein
MGQLVFQATAGGQTALVGPNPSTNFSLNVPAVNSTLATLAAQTFTGQQTDTVDASISGLTVGKGGGAVATGTALGYQAGYSNTTGASNTAIGNLALRTNSTSSYNTAVGDSALNATTGQQNTAIGFNAGVSNSTGAFNLFAGVNAGNQLTTGTYNVALGNSSLNGASGSGSYNVAVGAQALLSNTTASYNTAVGYQAGYSTTTGERNAFFGIGTGSNNTTGSYNTYIGGSTNCAHLMTTGSYNTILGGYSGNQGGLDIRTASNYVVLSEGTGSPVMVFNNSGNASIGSVSPTTGYEKLSVMQSGSSSLTGLAVGYGTSSATYRSAYVYSNGNFYFNNGNNEGYLSSAGTWTNASDARLKKNITDIKYGLNAVMQTQPRSYNMISTEGDFIGFIAQELKNIIPEVVSGGEVDEEHPDGKQYGVDYGSLVAVAFKAIQELKAEFDAYKAIHP